jgi:predicted HTH domain antitoxin
MTKLVTTRIDSKIVSRIERAAESLQTDKASLLRRIFIKGLREVSLGKACDMLGITKWDAPDLLKKYNAAMNYTLEDLKRDMAP